MLVNAINQTNRQSRAYIFVDQSLERENGQIVYQTRETDITEPRIYIRGSISQLDSDVVSDSVSLNIDLQNAPNPISIEGGPLKNTNKKGSRKLSVVSVDMHLVSWPSKTVIPGSSVANSMVVTGDSWGAGANGLIKMTGFDFSLQMNRVESQGQAVRNLIELGVIELLGRHARVPYWECLQLRTTNEKVTERMEKEFVATPHNIKITDVQVYLVRLGYLRAPKTGVLDRATRAALSRFQANEGLIATGDLDFDVFERLKERALGKPVLIERPITGTRIDPPSTALPVGLIKSTTANKNLSRTGASLTLNLPKTSYRVGETLRANLSSQHDGFMACYHQTNFGPITQILPVDPDQRLSVSHGTAVPVPNPQSRFDITFESSGDEEAILCVLDQSGKPVKVSKARADSPLGQIEAKSFKELVLAYRRQSKNVVWKEVRAKAE